MTSQIIFEMFDSPALRGNPLGDPSVRRTPVYLPAGYDQSTERYPTVYILAGFTGRGLGYLNDSLWEENIQQRLDRLIASGKVRPLIAVLPDASTRYGGSQYRNSSATGAYEDHMLELVTYIDSRYRSLADPAYRAITGISSGGYGATILAMRHPQVFGLLADLSGDKYFEWCYKPDILAYLRYYASKGLEGIQTLLADPGAVRPKSGDFFGTLNVAAMAACYSPNPQTALGFDLPFVPETGELIPEVWARWEACDPVNMAEVYVENLRSLRLLYFECGLRDEYNLQWGARIFASRLQKLGIAHRQVEFDDGHRSLAYRYDFALEAISAAMPA